MLHDKNAFIASLSPHLFWDVKQANIDAEKHKLFMIQRVLEYGLMEDWHATLSYYGKEEIATSVVQFRYLETKALHFASAIFDIPLKDFRCYAFRQSSQNFWPG